MAAWQHSTSLNLWGVKLLPISQASLLAVRGSSGHQKVKQAGHHACVRAGGFGVVYKGSWKGSIAAVKVMYARQHERQVMKDALEVGGIEEQSCTQLSLFKLGRGEG